MSIFKQFIKESFDREFNYQKIHFSEFTRKNNLFWESINKDNGTIFVSSKKKLTIKKIEKYLK